MVNLKTAICNCYADIIPSRHQSRRCAGSQ